MNAMSIRSLFIIAATVLLTAAPVFAQQQDIGSVEILNPTAIRCLRLPYDIDQTADRGYVQMARLPKGQVFVVVWCDLKVTLGKDEDGDDILNIREESINVEAGGKKYGSPASCSRDGRLEEGSGIYLYSQPESGKYAHSMVFAVPDTETKFKLNIGAASVDLEVKGEPAETLDRTQIAMFKIDSVKIVDKLERNYEIGYRSNADVKLSVELPMKYMIVSVLIKPKAPNRGTEFNLSGDDFRVQFADWLTFGPIGYYEGGTDFYAGYDGMYSEADAFGEFKAERMDLVYPLPAKATKFKFLYLMQEVETKDVPK
jgi:hypothetical protein